MTTQQEEAMTPHPLELRDEFRNMPATLEDLDDSLEDVFETDSIVALAMVYAIAELMGKNVDDVQRTVQKYLPPHYHRFFEVKEKNPCVCDVCMSSWPQYTPGKGHVDSYETFKLLLRGQSA